MANQNVGQLTTILGSAVDQTNDRFYIWDANEAGAARSKAIIPSEMAAAISAALRGDITASQLTMATARILGRSTASTGAVEEISIGSGLSLAAGVLSASGGGVSNIQQTSKTDTFTLNSTTFTDITAFSVSITPSTNTKKVLVLVSIICGTNTAAAAMFRLLRDSTPINVGDTAGSRLQASAEAYPNSNTTVECVTFSFLDSPATASAVTYKVQMRCTGAANCHVNRTDTDTNSGSFARYASSIIAMEVG